MEKLPLAALEIVLLTSSGAYSNKLSCHWSYSTVCKYVILGNNPRDTLP